MNAPGQKTNTMRELAIQILKKNDLFKFAKEIRLKFRQLKLKIRKADSSIIDNYFSKHETRKLHIGCGNNAIDGWLNTDFPHLRPPLRILMQPMFFLLKMIHSTTFFQSIL